MNEKTLSVPNGHPHGQWIESDYVCPRWIAGGHAQTLWPVLQPRPPVVFRRERVTTPDNDFWDFDWLEIPGKAPAADDAPLVVLFHGLEGSSHSHYACSLMAAVAERGWRGVVPHFRGCSGELNLTARAYHMGDYSEIGAILSAIRDRIPEDTAIYAAGVSLGGSALLNWLGRPRTADSPSVKAAATISTPIDLVASGEVLDEGVNRHIYERNFMSTLKPKALSIARRYPGKLDAQKIAQINTLTEFDNVVTAPLHGFIDAADYRQRASSRPWLSNIDVPTLLLNALNDPLVPADSLPDIRETSPHVFIERTTDGGHAGFPSPATKPWMPQRVLSFFENCH